LTFSSPRIRLHFQYGPDGRLGSPQVAAGNMRDVAETRYLGTERIEVASRRLEELRRLINRDELAAALAVQEPVAFPDTNPAVAYGPMSQSRTSNEVIMRFRNAKLAQSATPAEALPLSARSTLNQGLLQAVWVGPALLLARRVRVEEGTFLQGCWLDWDVIRKDLIESAADLVPHASLEPVRAPSGLAPSRMMASLPVRLVPGPSFDEPESWWSPIRLSLWIAGTCLVLAAVAIGLVLRSALSLSERRGTFVSAVTHELRTPLTTFRLYTEMLDEGMVSSPDSQRTYVKTLRGEADRLGHLVENVLAFARLERGRATSAPEIVRPAEMLDRLAPRLAERARQSGMELVIGPTPVLPAARLDVSVVDQILSNLVDNAVKYAGRADDRRIHLEMALAGQCLLITVRDHGPGVPREMRRRLFRPFSKSAHDAAQSAPGVGLGLALCRRLARSFGGDLRVHENGSDGACFALTVPLR
jgi:signal transduction histidine kinase